MLKNVLFLRYIFISLFQLLFLLSVPEGYDTTTQDWCFEITMFSIIVVTFQLVSFNFLPSNRSFLIITFLILSYLFNLSQVALYIYDSQLSEQFGMNSVMRRGNVKESAVIAVQSIICVYWGVASFLTFFGTKLKKVMTPIKYEPQFFFIIILLVIGFFCDFLYNIYVAITMGYGNDEGNQFTVFIRTFSLLLPSGVALLLTRNSLSLTKKNVIFITFLIYKVICMMTGYRAFALISLVLIFYLYTSVCYKIRLTPKTILAGIAIGFIGTALLVGIRETRSEGVDVMVMYQQLEDSETNPFVNILSEFGITLNVLAEVLAERHGIGSGGSQLIESFLSVIPGARSLLPDLDFDAMVLDTALGIHKIGGSYISDLLFDFGIEGIMPTSFILGLLLSLIIYNFESYIINGEYNKVALWFPIMVDLIFCIRSSLAKLPRMTIWYMIIFYVLWVLFSGKGIKLQKK